MLTEERFSKILRILDEKDAVTVLELTQLLNISESTIRRDLTNLNNMGKLNKVHGGATSLSNIYSTEEDNVSVKYDLNTEEKIRIAKYAASLINSNDFVYIDAGTTTEAMIDYIVERNATYVTNGIFLARKLALRDFKVYVLAGKIKAITEAIVGSEAVNSLSRYHFTVGFFGTNSISITGGYSTPDIDEARTKTEAVSRCKKSYILSDSSKFGKLSAVTFAQLSNAEIITSALEDKKYKNYTNVTEV